MTRHRNVKGQFSKIPRQENGPKQEKDLYEESYWESVGRKPYPKKRTRTRKPEAPPEEVMHHGSVKAERDNNAGEDRRGESKRRNNPNE